MFISFSSLCCTIDNKLLATNKTIKLKSSKCSTTKSITYCGRTPVRSATCMLGQTASRDPGSQSVRLAASVIAAKLRTGDQILVSSSASLSKFALKFRRSGDQYVVSKTQKYIDFDISGLQDRYIGLHDGLRIESPLISLF